MNDVDERLRNIEVEQARAAGEAAGIKKSFGILIALVLAWAGYESIYQIPNLVEKNVRESAQNYAKEEIDKLVVESEQNKNKIEKLVAEASIVLEENTIQNKLAKLDYLISQADYLKDELEGLTENTALENISSSAGGSIENKRTIFSNLWAKPGYYLSVGEDLTLNILDVEANSCIAVVRNSDGGDIQKSTFLPHQSIRINNYDFILQRVGGAGLNPLTKACYFSVYQLQES